MKVIMLTSWAGEHFSLAHGDLVLMPDALARDRFALGHVRMPTAEEFGSLELRLFPGMAGINPPSTNQPQPRRTKEKRRASRPRQ